MTLRIAAAALCVAVSFAPLSSAQAQQPEPTPKGATITIGTKPLEPFVVKKADGQLSGFSIDLWSEIAKLNGWETKWEYRETVKEVLADAEASKVDAGIAGISMTKEREAVLDFSYPMFNSGLQVMVGPSSSSKLRETLGELLPLFLTITGAVAAIAFVAGHVMWLFNRKDEEWPDGYLRGAGHGMWLAASTLLANDPGTPRRLFGRLVSLLWVLTGILFVATFTANLSSDRTVASIEGKIKSIDDLPGKLVVTVENTTASKELDVRGIQYTAVKNITDAYPLLWNKQADAIVYDAPVLLYHASKQGKGREQIVGSIFKPEPYGIALPTGSANREKINDALLTLQSNGTYQQLYDKYFGQGAR